MRILVLADHLVMGGLETHIVSFTNELLLRGHQIMLYAASISPYVLSQIEDRQNSFTFMKWTKDPVNDVKPFNPDIIHAHPFTAIMKGRQIAEALNKPLIVSMHGKYDFGLDRSPTGNKVSKLVKRVIAVDLRVATLLIRSAAHPEKVSVIRNGINMKAFRPQPVEPAERIKYNLNPDWFTIVIVSRIADGKERPIMQLLRCAPALAEQLQGLNILVVGDGAYYSKLREETASLMKHAGRSNLNIELVGRQDDIPGFIALSDLVMACGRAALEALACRRPVFAMQYGFAGAVNDENQHEILFNINGFRKYADEELITELAHLAKNREYREQLALDGYKIIQRHYDIAASTTQLERIYEQYV